VNTASLTELIRQRLFAPLNLAAYVTWAAVAIEVAGRRAALPYGMACLLLFLAGFTWRALGRPDHGRADPSRAASPGFLLMVAAFLALLWSGPAGSTPVLLIIVAVVAAMHLRAAWLAAVLGTLNLLMLLVFVYRWQAPNPLQLLLVFGGFQMFAVITVQAQRRATEAADQLRRVNADLLTTRSLLAEGVREAERLRLSRELHDVSGHKLTALKLHLTALARDPGRDARHDIAQAAEIAGGLLADIRAVVSQLRRHDGIAIGEMLETLVRGWPAPAVSLAVGADLRVDDIEQAETLLRIAQEGLTNAARHAQAHRVWIDLHDDAAQLTLRIEDDGRGAATLVPGVGLTGMRERVSALEGSLEIDHGPRGGLRLTARLPRTVAAP
jgi:signal transduction histidine kinase